jgi:hypothetical protein
MGGFIAFVVQRSCIGVDRADGCIDVSIRNRALHVNKLRQAMEGRDKSSAEALLRGP